MTGKDLYMQPHPTVAALALFARRDLPFAEQFKVRMHVRKCPACRNEAAAFSEGSERLRSAARTEGVAGLEHDWAGLEREMLGNIAVGVAAARCIENVGRRRVVIRTGWFVAALVVLFVLGWFSHIPMADNRRIFSAIQSAVAHHSAGLNGGPELKATADGIAVQAQGSTLRLMHPESAIVSLSGSSGMTARYVDEDTGEVTITKVYASE